MQSGRCSFFVLSRRVVQYTIPMRKCPRRVCTAILCAVLCAVVLAVCFWVYPAANAEDEREPVEYGGILRLWHIDSFEGGKGSRASFLRDVARDYAGESGVFVLVSTYTAESAAAAIKGGDIPDLLSFGTDCPFAADVARPLEGYSFPYARAGGDTLAYPWCRGAYFLFLTGKDPAGATAQNTVLGTNGKTAAAVAAVRGGLPSGDYRQEEPLRAYSDLVSGKYSYLVATQRDYWRLSAKGVSFRAEPLGDFSDLWQYMCVCTGQKEAYARCLAFLDYLLSEDVQARLPRIGMLSAKYAVYGNESVLLQADALKPALSVSAFLSEEARAALLDSAVLALRGDKNGAKKLENFLI